MRIHLGWLVAACLVLIPHLTAAQDRPPTERERRIAEARRLYDSAAVAFGQRDQVRGRRLNQASLAIGRELNDPATISRALVGLARNALRDRDFNEVRKLARESIAVEEKAGNPAISGYHMLAAAARMEGKDEEAAMYYEYTLGLLHATGGQSGFAGELYNLGMARLHSDQVDAARRLFTLSLAEYRKLDNEPGMAYSLGGFAAIAAVEGYAERANELYGAMEAALARAGITLDPDDQQDYDRYSALAARGGNSRDGELARARGRTLSVQQAAELATGPRKQ